MSMITKAVRSVMNCALMIAFAVPVAATAAGPVTPANPAPVPKPKPKLYQAPVQNDVTAAYEYRTRISAGKSGCQRFAMESDAAFLDEKTSSEAKVALLKRIGTEAGASGCLTP